MAVNVDVSFLPNVGNHLVALRIAMDALVRDGTYIQAMGGATFLEGAPFSLLEGDAAAIVNTVGSVTSTNPVVQAVYLFLSECVTFTGGS